MYKFTVNQNYEDYSSGRVLYGATGASNFPVRLSSEIFQRAAHYLQQQGNAGPYAVYDPCCGAAYSLTVLGFLHGKQIASMAASDADATIISVAQKNLGLLTAAGMDKRIVELKDLEKSFHKDSHKEALHSATRLAKQLPPKGIIAKVFAHNILSGQKLPLDLSSIDLIITDLPYGKLNQWQGVDKQGATSPAQQFLDSIHGRLNPKAVIALSFNKKQTVTHEGFKKIESFKMGLRKVLVLSRI